MHFEKPQPGNPNRITVRQHVFPTKSIERFANDSGRVEIQFKDRNKTNKVRPTDAAFTAKRVWDQSSEAGYMKRIEDSFQAVSRYVLSGNEILSTDQMKDVSRFHMLWRLRVDARSNRPPELKLKGVLPGERVLTEDQEEKLEVNGYSYLQS